MVDICRFCVICGKTKDVNEPEYKPKTLWLVDGNNKEDLGYVCDGCLKYLEDGGVFKKSKQI